MNNLEIYKVVQRCRDRERRAQSELVQYCGPLLLTVCRRYTSDTDEAKDVLQDAFVKIFKNLDNIAVEEGSIMAYFKQICIHTALDHLRKQKRIQRTHMVVMDQENYAEPVVFQNLNIEYIIGQIQKLSEYPKLVFNLYVLDGMSHKEISEFLLITESTSRAYLSRARKKLQVLLSEYSTKLDQRKNVTSRR